MQGLSIFKLFTKDKEVWTKYESVISKMGWEKETNNILKVISRYYKEYPDNQYISKDELVEYFHVEYPQLKNKGVYEDVIDRIYELDTSREVAGAVIDQLVLREFANQIANAVLPILSGEEAAPNLKAVEELLIAYQEFDVPKEEVEEFANDDLDALIESIGKDGLMWRLKCLQTALGPLIGGTLGHVFARPEAGKTTLVHSELSFIVPQLKEEECAIWINNEEDKKRILMRWYTAVTGWLKGQIDANPIKARTTYVAKHGNKLRLKDDANFSVEDVEKLCMKYKPRIVVIDQGDKITYRGMSKAGNGADRLKQVYDKLREVTKRCNNHFKMDMITIGQADVVAEGKKWLLLSNLDSGKTGKAGAFDYVIGIGKTYTENTRRYITLCKNKLESGEGIGDKFVVEFDNVRARYTD